MNKPTQFKHRLPVDINSILPMLGIKIGRFPLLGIIGLLIIAIFVYGIGFRKNSTSKINYSPEDITYGEEFQATHDTRLTRDPRNISLISVDPSKKPEVQVSEKFFDFGDVNSDHILTRTFVIANMGQSPLIIKRAYTTCGCTKADFTASEILPEKVALMTLQFDPGYHEMHGTTVRRGVMIETNDPYNPIQEIWIQASIR